MIASRSLMATLTTLVTFSLLVVVVRSAQHAGVRCNKVIHLELNESFSVARFPRPEEYEDPPFGYHFDGPRECTLSFRAVGDCSLSWRTTHYERGDIDCEQQYFLVGDENKEKRVCGFSRPPRSLNSTGKYLFLTHYSRNGGGYGRRRTINSYIGGVVRCEKVPAPCQVPTQTCTDGSGGARCNALPCLLERRNPPPTTELFNCPFGSACVVHHSYCQATVPLAQTCVVDFPDISQTIPGSDCFIHDIPCPAEDPNCSSTTGVYHFGGTPIALDSAPCGSPGTHCTRRALFCFQGS